MTQYAISMHPEGICLNEREYVLESDHPNADVKLFDSASDAESWLRKHWDDMPENPEDIDEYGVFIEPYEWPDDDEEQTVPWLTRAELWALDQGEQNT